MSWLSLSCRFFMILISIRMQLIHLEIMCSISLSHSLRFSSHFSQLHAQSKNERKMLLFVVALLSFCVQNFFLHSITHDDDRRMLVIKHIRNQWKFSKISQNKAFKSHSPRGTCEVFQLIFFSSSEPESSYTYHMCFDFLVIAFNFQYSSLERGALTRINGNTQRGRNEYKKIRMNNVHVSFTCTVVYLSHILWATLLRFSLSPSPLDLTRMSLENYNMKYLHTACAFLEWWRWHVNQNQHFLSLTSFSVLSTLDSFFALFEMHSVHNSCMLWFASLSRRWHDWHTTDCGDSWRRRALDGVVIHKMRGDCKRNAEKGKVHKLAIDWC